MQRWPLFFFVCVVKKKQAFILSKQRLAYVLKEKYL